MIPPFVSQVIGVLVRAVVVFLVGWIAAHGGPSFTDDQVTKVVSEIVPLAAVLAWSLWQKYRGRQKLLTGIASNAGLSENHVEMLVASGQAPSIMTPKHVSPTLTAPASSTTDKEQNP